MNPQYDLQIAVTKQKLASLQICYESIRQETEGDEFVRIVTLRSLKRTINQFKEDLVRLQAHAHNPAR